jgi:hypothetical protein
MAASGQQLSRRLDKRQARIELACLVFLVEVIEWIVPLTPDPRKAYSSLALVIFVLLAVCYVRDGASARELGFRFDNLLRALARISPYLVAFVLLLLAIGALIGTLRFGNKFFSMLLSLPPWALTQQYMLLAFAHRRFLLLFGERSVFATAGLFSLLHLPNPILTIACAAGGYIWAREYERNPNLIANALTHTVASAVLASSLPSWLLKNMVVGYNYFLR